MRFLVAGGAGFIGSHLVEALVNNGSHVDIIDDLSSGKIDNLRDVARNPKLSLHIDRIENQELAAACMEDCSAVFHLVPGAIDKGSRDEPTMAIRKAITKAQTLLELAAPRKIPLVMLVPQANYSASSLELSLSPQSEIALTKGLRLAAYRDAATHAIYEYIAMVYRTKSHAPITVARVAPVTGPRQSNGLARVVRSYVEMAAKNDQLVLPGRTEGKIEFCHISSVIRDLLGMVNPTMPDWPAIADVGTVETTSVSELIRAIDRVLGKASDFDGKAASAAEFVGRSQRAADSVDPSSGSLIDQLVRDIALQNRQDTDFADHIRRAG